MSTQPDTASTFRCPTCSDTFQPHWLATDNSGLCRTCAERRDGFCKWGDEHPQHFDQHPCSTSAEEPGDPCRWCAAPVPLNGDPCSNCWQTFEGMSIADVKAIFAADADDRGPDEAVFDVKPRLIEEPTP